MRRFGYTSFLSAASCALVAAQLGLGASGCAARDPALRELAWFDGEDRRPVIVDPRWVAVAVVDPAATRATAPPGPGVGRALQLLEVTSAEDQAALAHGRLPPGIAGAISPVFTSAPAGGHRMALTGDVIVWLDLAMSEADCRGWLARHRLSAGAPLGGARNAFVVRAQPGLPALALANALRKKKGVRAASPDWWREAVTR